ncbi:MAG: AraC family transcriptional regulator [Clostridiales bacterium]|nr:AraC family transcriptional regulator [Clostridiales bacterium]
MANSITTFSLDNHKNNNTIPNIVLFIHNEDTFYPLLHTHDFYELIFIEDGECGHFANNKNYSLCKYDACILHPNIMHRHYLTNDKNICLYSFGISKDCLNSILENVNLTIDEVLKNPITNFSLTQSEVNNLTSSLYSIKTDSLDSDNYYTSPLFSSTLKIIISEIIFKIFRQERLQKTNTHNVYVNKILKELSNVNNFKLSIEEICEKFSFSHGYITHLFKKANLQAPNKIFLQNKLSHASMLLQNSNIKIWDIMETCGIFSSSYFNKVFKKEFGITPSEFRKNSAIYKQSKNVYIEN